MVYHFKTRPLSLDELNGALQRYVDIMEGRPIIDITLSSTDSCPAGYELLRLGTWDGTKEGCWKEHGMERRKVAGIKRSLKISTASSEQE